MRVHLKPRSTNGKTGPIPVSTTSAESCPASCPLNSSGCYAQHGPLAIHWRAVTEGRYGVTWSVFCRAIAALPDGTLWRHNQAGDLPGNGARDRIDTARLARLVDANRGKRGFTYTHYPMTCENARAVRAANKSGFTINLSANNAAHADALLKTRAGPVVVVVPRGTGKISHTPKGTRIVRCPAEYQDVSCATCGLCQRADRDYVIGFTAHGVQAKRVDVIARG